MAVVFAGRRGRRPLPIFKKSLCHRPTDWIRLVGFCTGRFNQKARPLGELSPRSEAEDWATERGYVLSKNFPLRHGLCRATRGRAVPFVCFADISPHCGESPMGRGLGEAIRHCYRQTDWVRLAVVFAGDTPPPVSSSSGVAPRDSSHRSRMTAWGDAAKDLGRIVFGERGFTRVSAHDGPHRSL